MENVFSCAVIYAHWNAFHYVFQCIYTHPYFLIICTVYLPWEGRVCFNTPLLVSPHWLSLTATKYKNNFGRTQCTRPSCKEDFNPLSIDNPLIRPSSPLHLLFPHLRRYFFLCFIFRNIAPVKHTINVKINLSKLQNNVTSFW